MTVAKQNRDSVRLLPYILNFILVNAYYFTLKIFNWWHFLGFQGYKPSFADLRAYTAQVSCSQNAIDYLAYNCDPWNREIGLLKIYVPILEFFNLNESKTELLGITFQLLLFAMTYFLSFAFGINLGGSKAFVLMLLALTSPPIAIAIERGQFEIVLLIFTILAGFLLSRDHIYSVFLLFGFLTILKIYPVIVLILLLASRRIVKSMQQQLFGIFVLALSVGTVLYAIVSQGGSSPTAALSTHFERTFGVTVLPHLTLKFLKDIRIIASNFEFTLWQAHLVGMLFSIVIILILIYLHSKGKTFGPDLTSVTKEKSVLSMTTLLSLGMVGTTYFVISSFDYRMIYLVPLFLAGLAQEVGMDTNRLRSYLVYGVIFVMWAQVSIWTSAFAQIPILVTLILILFNMGSVLRAHFVCLQSDNQTINLH